MESRGAEVVVLSDTSVIDKGPFKSMNAPHYLNYMFKANRGNR